MAQSNNTFCWNGLVTADAEKSVDFFCGVFGWTTEQVDMGDGPMTLLSNAGQQIAHVRAPQDGEPTWWNNYLRVENVDAATETLHSRGGTVVVPPTDILVGRFSTVRMPSGAQFSLYRENEGEDQPTGKGFVHWVDLHSADLEPDLKALAALGFTTEAMAMPTGTYHVLSPNNATRGGAMKGMNPDAPSMWLAWVEVASADAVLADIEARGGSIVAPAWDAEGVGRMVIARDPVGLVFGVIEPAAA